MSSPFAFIKVPNVCRSVCQPTLPGISAASSAGFKCTRNNDPGQYGRLPFLPPKELDLLRYLTQHPNEALSHRELLQAVWGPDYGDQVDYLRVFVKNLRKKMEPNPESLNTLLRSRGSVIASKALSNLYKIFMDSPVLL